ncbi:MAG TPA: type II toxin-antitoxin system Phd/YefM family antitoxin [Polyangiaceae bacterium]|nr:type II toxin-antitoxin system Phd/YefM family antitoxin [Polyangiaceae bacterium]
MVTYRWRVAEAKASLSELVRESARGPQRIENRGREVAVVLSIEDYQRLTEAAEQGSGASRLRRFLRLSAELREGGGADIELPAREQRPSPFAADEEPKRAKDRPRVRPKRSE